MAALAMRDEAWDGDKGCVPLFCSIAAARDFALDQAHLVGNCNEVATFPNNQKLAEFLKLCKKQGCELVTSDPLGDDVQCHAIDDAIGEIEQCHES